MVKQKALRNLQIAKHSKNNFDGYLWIPSREPSTCHYTTSWQSTNTLPNEATPEGLLSPAQSPPDLTETFATDTLFSSTPGIGGITCVQLFVGKSSQFTLVYGMKTECKGPSALQDFIREHSIPSALHNDNSKMQTGTAWNDILQKYSIKAKQMEPHAIFSRILPECRIKIIMKSTLARSWTTLEHLPNTWFLYLLYAWSFCSTTLLWKPLLGRCLSSLALGTHLTSLHSFSSHFTNLSTNMIETVDKWLQ